MNTILFTIGHSTHPIHVFVDLLRRHGVTALADVRSAPYSRRHPQFNREALRGAIEAEGIRYVYLGKELGGRRKAGPTVSIEGRDKPGPTSEFGAKADPEFDAGIERLLRGAGEYTVAIMCAEKDPRNCHRTHLVTPALVARGVTVRHILANGEILEHGDLAAGEGEDDLFRND